MIREQLAGGNFSPSVGTIIVTYNSSSEIIDCIRSVLTSDEHAISLVIVDNNSSDDSVGTLKKWFQSDKSFETLQSSPPEETAAGTMGCQLVSKTRHRAHDIIILRSSTNLGFAGGVNIGLSWLAQNKKIQHYWILNPDCVADSRCVINFLNCAKQNSKFGIAGGRVYYAGTDQLIQSDGGIVNMWTGTCIPYNHKRLAPEAADPSSMRIDYISGAHMFVSRAFVEAVGYMPEEYFLYYEEVDWCLQRGDFTIHYCPNAPVYHAAGHSAGSGNAKQGQSPLSAYFMARSRIIFVRKFRPIAIPLAFVYSLLRISRGLLRGDRRSSGAALRGLFGLQPDKVTLERLRESSFPARYGRH